MLKLKIFLILSIFFCLYSAASSRIYVRSAPPSLVTSKKYAQVLKNDYFILPIAGGLAGGVATFLLYPIDSIKSMCQNQPTEKAFQIIQKTLSSFDSFFHIYTGVIPAAVGAIPSSAIYFGSYEYCKKFLASHIKDDFISKPIQHMLAAASGNLMSSSIFVPKDLLKHKMQGIQAGNIVIAGFKPNNINLFKLIGHIFKTKGIAGFYPSYRATLLKNVPSAVIRFSIYEELKTFVHQQNQTVNLGYMIAGGIASALSSFATTPLDVVKTRIATGVLPPGSPIIRSVLRIGRTEGTKGLFAGGATRLVWSAFFGGIGFTSFEAFKKILAVNETTAVHN